MTFWCVEGLHATLFEENTKRMFGVKWMLLASGQPEAFKGLKVLGIFVAREKL